MYTSGNFALTFIFIYGYVLSSFNNTLNFGIFFLIKLHSNTNASASLSHTIYSKWSIKATIFKILCVFFVFLKYEVTLLFNEIALPTYIILSSLSCIIYTPGFCGNFFNSFSILNFSSISLQEYNKNTEKSMFSVLFSL